MVFWGQSELLGSVLPLPRRSLGVQRSFGVVLSDDCVSTCSCPGSCMSLYVCLSLSVSICVCASLCVRMCLFSYQCHSRCFCGYASISVAACISVSASEFLSLNCYPLLSLPLFQSASILSISISNNLFLVCFCLRPLCSLLIYVRLCVYSHIQTSRHRPACLYDKEAALFDVRKRSKDSSLAFDDVWKLMEDF